MTTITVTVRQKGIQERGVESLVEKLKDKYPDASISVRKYEPPESRDARYQEAIDKVEEGKQAMEELQGELQEWRDNLPENLQSGNKALELDEAIDALQEAIDEAENAAGHEVTFPGMY
jgi:hypothetical protein